MAQAVGLHRGDDQSVAAEQADSLANRRPRFDERGSDRQYLNAKSRDLLHALAKAAELLDLSRVSPEALRKAWPGPTKDYGRLESH